MSLSNKELKNLKNQLKKNRPDIVSNIRNRKTTIRATNENGEILNKSAVVKSVIKWNFGVNDLVEVLNYKDKSIIGLIVSDYIYHTRKVEKNNFFVLIDNVVKELDGRYLRKI